MDRTVYNALQAFEKYAMKYGKNNAVFELKYNFRLQDEEVLWLINKLFEKRLIDDYDKEYLLDYLDVRYLTENSLRRGKRLREALSKDIFDTSHINIPYWNGLLNSQRDRDYYNREAKVVQMSPRKYFEECGRSIFGNSYTSQINQISQDDDIFDWMKDQIAKGKKLPLPFLDYADKGQDGRHRMYVAGELFGWDTKFPVAVFTVADEEKEKEKLKEKELNKISRALDRIESRILNTTYRNEQELKEELEYALDSYLEDFEVKIERPNDEILNIVINGFEFTYNYDDFNWGEDESIDDAINSDDDDVDYDEIEKELARFGLDLKEGVREDGETIIKGVLYHWKEEPKKQVEDFEDFEIDGVYRLGEDDYIAFEKRNSKMPTERLHLVHADVEEDLITPLYDHFDGFSANTVGISLDNLNGREDISYDLEDNNLGKFAKYGPTLRRAAYKFFR